jgi:transglutaminase-like putative cysteine protease/multisubunit Na+/H+ antiporter MnhB subunit
VLARTVRRNVRTSERSVRELLRALAPTLLLAVILALALALGTKQPAAAFLDGAVFAVVCLLWTAWRIRRQRPRGRGRRLSLRRGLGGVGVLAVAAGLAVLAVPAVARGLDRSVLRDYVVPPLNLSQYPSPLVGYRKYTKDANRLWDQTLFTVTGLPEDSWVRIATLNDYDGTVWGTTDEASFNRVGARLTVPETVPAGQAATIHVTIGEAYAGASDLNPWLPEAGVVTGLTFEGPRAHELATSLHYSRELSSGILPTRLRAGDSYTMTTTIAQLALPDDVQPFSRPALTDNAQGLLTNLVATWVGDAPDLHARLDAVARYLRDNGAYTNGGPNEEQYLPGHSTGRLSTFMQSPQPAGDDEQFAATYALIANHLGVPARVVFGARPDGAGVVRGSAVHARVEVHVADRGWVPIPESTFMPDITKRPSQKPPDTFQDEKASVVPPPNAIRLPTTPTDTSRNDAPPFPPDTESWWDRIWTWLRPALVYGGPPLLVIGGYLGVVLGLKRRRRRLRRDDIEPANRYDGAWQEMLDLVRDMAAVVPSLRGLRFNRGLTRQQQARLLDGKRLLRPEELGPDVLAAGRDGPFLGLAREIDHVVFGDGGPGDKAVDRFWQRLDAVQAELLKGLGRRKRLVVRLNPRSLRPEVLPPLPTEFSVRLAMPGQSRPAPPSAGAAQS